MTVAEDEYSKIACLYTIIALAWMMDSAPLLAECSFYRASQRVSALLHANQTPN